MELRSNRIGQSVSGNVDRVESRMCKGRRGDKLVESSECANVDIVSGSGARQKGIKFSFRGEHSAALEPAKLANLKSESGI